MKIQQIIKVCLIGLVLCLLIGRTEADFLSDYLDDKTFGPNPGPCVNQGDCNVNLDPPFSWPSGIGGIEVCLIDFVGIGCQPLEDWVTGGFAQIWDVRCSNLGVRDISLTALTESPESDSLAISRLTVVDGLQECDGSFFFRDLKLRIEIPALVALLPPFFGRRFVVIEATASGTWTTRKRSANPNGVSIQFDLEFKNTQGTPFSQDLPDQVEILPDSCSIDLSSLFQGRGLGLRLSLGGFGSFDEVLLYAENSDGSNPTGSISVGFLVRDALINLIIYIFETLFAGIVCQIIEQGGSTDSGDPGILNILLDEALDLFYNDIKGTADDIQFIHNTYFRDEQYSTFPALDQNQALIPQAIDFDSSRFFEVLTVTINDWLGSGTPRLVVNEAIDLLTDPDGTFVFDLVEEAVELGLELPLLVSNVGAFLESVEAGSFNTISQFNILERIPNTNGAGGSLNHGLNHEFRLDELFISFRIALELNRGEWVTRSSCGTLPFSPTCTIDSSKFSFKFTLKVENIDVAVQTLSLINPGELDDVKLGNIFGRDLSQDVVEPLTQSAKCAAPALYGFNFTTLAATVGVVSDETSVSDFSDQSLTTLINDSKDLLLELFESIFSVHLDGILNGIVRQAINDFLLEFVTLPADSSNCVPYTPGTGVSYLTFDSVIATAVFRVINDVLGAGSQGTNADINDAIQVLLEYFSEEIELFPVEATGTQGTWVAKEAYENFLALTAFPADFPTGDAFMNLTTFSLTNVNTINQLVANAIGSTGFGFDFTLGDQPNNNPLDIVGEFFIKVDRDGILEQFTVSFELDFGLELDFSQFLIDTNKVNELTFGQLSSLPCLGSVFDGVISTKDSIVLNDFDFDIVALQTSPGSPPLKTALAGLRTELSGSESSRIRTMVSTILSNSLTKIIDEVEAFDPTSTPADCSTKEDPLANLFDTFLGINLPNLTSLVETCLATPDPVESVTVSESRIGGLDAESNYLNMSSLGSTLNTILSTASLSSTLTQVLRTVANATGNPVSDLLILEDDQSVTLEIDISQPNFLFNLTGFSGFRLESDLIIPDLVLELNILRVKGLENILNDFTLLEPKPNSDFITGSSFAFSDSSPLDVELNGFFQSDASFVGGTPGDTLREDILINFKLDELSIAFDVLFALNLDSLLAKSLGHFLTVESGTQRIMLPENAIDCLFELLFENGFYLPFLSISLGNIDDVSFTAPTDQLLSNNLESVINELIQLVTSFYVGALPNICQNCIRTIINDQFVKLQSDPQFTGSCPIDPYPPVNLAPEDELFRFSTSPDIALLQTVLNDFFYDGGTFGLWNTLMDGLTKTPLLENNPIGAAVNFVYQGIDYGEVSFSFQNIILENLDTFTYVDILRPVGSPDDYSTISGFNLDGPLGVQFDLSVGAERLIKGFENLQNDIQLKFVLDDIEFFNELLLQVNITKARNVKFSSIASISQIPCILVPVNALEIRGFNFSTTSIEIEASCIGECDIPFLDAFSAGNKFVSSNGEEVSNLVNDLIEFSVRYLNSVNLQAVIDRELANANLNCDEILCLLTLDCGGDAGPNDDIAAALTYLLVTGAVGSALSVAIIYPVHKRRREGRAAAIVADKTSALSRKQRLKIEKEEISSIFAHPRTPIWAKLLLPLICCANIGLLIFAIGYSDALNFLISLQFGGVETQEVTLVPFTMIGLINDMWNSGAWPLALLLLAASCTWPIVKNVLMILVWFLPTTILKVEYRVTVLQWLDALGKWSFLEAFVVVASIAALKTFVDISDQERLTFIPAGFLTTTVELVPEQGITILVIVAAISLVVNHVMSIYHHRVVRQVFINECKIQGIKPKYKAVARVKQSISHSRVKLHGLKRVSPVAVRNLLIAMGFGWLFVLLGISLPIVTFEVFGIVGQFLGLVDESLRVRTFSIIEIGATVYDYEEDPDIGRSISSAIFQFIFFITCVVAPLLLFIVNALLLTKKFTLKEQTNSLRAAQIISYWSSIEVIFLGLIGMMIELEIIIDYVADVITFDVCSNIEPLLVGTVGEVDGNCIKIIPIVGVGFVFVLFGAAIQLITSLITFTVVSAVIERRKVEGRHGDVEQSVPKMVRLKILHYFTIDHDDDEDQAPRQNEGQADEETRRRGNNRQFMSNTNANERPISMTAQAIAKMRRMRQKNPLRRKDKENDGVRKSYSNGLRNGRSANVGGAGGQELRTVNPMMNTNDPFPSQARNGESFPESRKRRFDPFPLQTKRRAKKKEEKKKSRERAMSEESIMV